MIKKNVTSWLSQLRSGNEIQSHPYDRIRHQNIEMKYENSMDFALDYIFIAMKIPLYNRTLMIIERMYFCSFPMLQVSSLLILAVTAISTCNIDPSLCLNTHENDQIFNKNSTFKTSRKSLSTFYLINCNYFSFILFDILNFIHLSTAFRGRHQKRLL